MKLPRVRSRETKTGPTVRKRGGFGDDDDDDDETCIRETVSIRNALGFLGTMGVNWRDYYWPGWGTFIFFDLGDWDMTHLLVRLFWHHVIYVICLTLRRWLVDEGWGGGFQMSPTKVLVYSSVSGHWVSVRRDDLRYMFRWHNQDKIACGPYSLAGCWDHQMDPQTIDLEKPQRQGMIPDK